MLTLKKENLSNLCATFLDLDISIVNGRFKYKLFDKRNAPEYKNKIKHIVRFPFRSSNMPSKMFHSTISAEILRICRATAAEDDFYRSATPFLSRMHKQGALEDETGKCMTKFLDRHVYEIKKFSINKAKVKNFVLKNLH